MRSLWLALIIVLVVFQRNGVVRYETSVIYVRWFPPLTLFEYEFTVILFFLEKTCFFCMSIFQSNLIQLILVCQHLDTVLSTCCWWTFSCCIGFLMEIGLFTKLLRAETLAHSFTLETYLLKRCPRAIKLTVEFFLPVSVFPYYDWKVNLLCNCSLSPLCSKDFVYIQSFNKYLFSN